MRLTKIVEKLISKYKKTLFILLFISSLGYSQTDTLFWFAAPDISNGNASNPNIDRPIFLRLSSYSSPATVVVSQPANPGFVPITVAMAPNSTSSIDLTTWISVIENFPANIVHNRGIKVVSTANITAYYEVRSTGLVNPGIYNLKGQNALGSSFYIPSQTSFNNSSGYPDVPENSFEIVATENATQVTITPSVNVVGHLAGIPYNITLNAGQTYSCHAVGLTAANHLSGTRVISNKPIAITIKDDLVRPNALPCADQMGDQIVPVTKLGTDYICVKGMLNYAPDIPNIDFAYILATQNGTNISVNGTYLATLNAGQSIAQNITSPSIFIQADAPIYVLQVSGNGCEFGQSLIPPLNNCSGNTSVSFTRSTNQNFYLLLLTQAGNESSFTVSSGAVVNPALFNPVPGTAGSWVSTIQQYTVAQVPVGTQINVSNSNARFHMAFINGNASLSGTMYGYFSDFVGLSSFKDSVSLCMGDSINISPITSAISYLWSDGSTLPDLLVSSPGIYYVDKTDGFCSARDSFVVSSAQLPNISLGNDTSICSGQNILFSGPIANQFIWSTGDTTQSIFVDSAGQYILEVISSEGCSNEDTIQLNIFPLPNLNLGNDTIVCENTSLNFNISGYESYLWSNGDTVGTLTIVDSGNVSLIVTDVNQCSASDTIDIVWSNIPDFLQSDTSVCIADTIIIGSTFIYPNYLWNTGDTSSTIIASNSGLYILNVVNEYGCPGSDSINVSWYLPSVLDLGNDITVCPNSSVLLNSGIFNSYFWSTGSDSSSTIISGSGTYYLNAIDSNGCEASDSIDIFLHTLNYPILPNDTIICDFDSLVISVLDLYPQYFWNDSSSFSFLIADQSGLYSILVVDSNGCESTDSINILGIQQLNINLGEDTLLCTTLSFTLNAGVGYDTYLWNDSSTGETLSINNTGQFYVTVSESGCTASDTINVMFDTPPVSVLQDSLNCILDSVLLNPGSGAITYLWNSGETSQTLWADNSGLYSVTLTNNICSVVDSIFVNLYSNNDIYPLSDTTLCEGDIIELIVPAGFDNYLWSNGTTQNMLTVSTTGLYWINISSCGANWTDSVSVIYKPSISDIIIPNVFTPNNDGVNDKFVMSGYNDIPAFFELTIYDRWGLLIFTTNDYINGWDGTYNGTLVTDGVYYFILNMESFCGQKLSNNNFLTLFR